MSSRYCIDVTSGEISRATRAAKANIKAITDFAEKAQEVFEKSILDLRDISEGIRQKIKNAGEVIHNICEAQKRKKEVIQKAQEVVALSQPQIEPVQKIDSNGNPYFVMECRDPFAGRRGEAVQTIEKASNRIEELENAKKEFCDYIGEREKTLETIDNILSEAETDKETMLECQSKCWKHKALYVHAIALCTMAEKTLSEINEVSIEGEGSVAPLPRVRFLNTFSDSGNNPHLPTKSEPMVNEAPSVVIRAVFSSRTELRHYLRDLITETPRFRLYFDESLSNFPFANSRLREIEPILAEFSIEPARTINGIRKIDLEGRYVYERQ